MATQQMSAAQLAQQRNRGGGGQYAEKLQGDPGQLGLTYEPPCTAAEPVPTDGQFAAYPAPAQFEQLPAQQTIARPRSASTAFSWARQENEATWQTVGLLDVKQGDLIRVDATQIGFESMGEREFEGAVAGMVAFDPDHPVYTFADGTQVAVTGWQVRPLRQKLQREPAPEVWTVDQYREDLKQERRSAKVGLAMAKEGNAPGPKRDAAVAEAKARSERINENLRAFRKDRVGFAERQNQWREVQFARRGTCQHDRLTKDPYEQDVCADCGVKPVRTHPGWLAPHAS